LIRSYALYRQRLFPETIALLRSTLSENDSSSISLTQLTRDEVTFCHHLLAQSCYLNGDYSGSSDMYSKGGGKWFSPSDPEVLTNFAAARVNDQSKADGDNAHNDKSFNRVFAENIENYDLGFNIGLSLWRSGEWGRAGRVFEEIEENAKKVLKGASTPAKQIDTEIRPIKTMAASCSFLTSGSSGRAKARRTLTTLANCADGDVGLRTVIKNNLAVVSSGVGGGGGGEEEDSRGDSGSYYDHTKGGGKGGAGEKILPGQRRELMRNKFLSLLERGEVDEGEKVLEDIKKDWGSGNKDVISDLEATLLVSKGDTAGALAAASPLYKSQLQIDSGDKNSAIDTILSIPSIQSHPSTIATLVEMYTQTGQSDKARDLLQSNQNGPNDRVRSRLLRSKGESAYASGRYQEAAGMFKESMEASKGGSSDDESDEQERLITLCWLVKSLSYFDIDEAESLENRIPSRRRGKNSKVTGAQGGGGGGLGGGGTWGGGPARF